MNRVPSPSITGLFAVAVLALAGCASRSPDVRYYNLSPVPVTGPATSELAVAVGPAEFPGALDRSRELMPGYTVVEVKFRYHVPSWFHRIIQSFELRRVSISKICRGIEVLELAENLS